MGKLRNDTTLEARIAIKTFTPRVVIKYDMMKIQEQSL